MSANRSGLPGTSAYRVYLYQYQVTGTEYSEYLVRSTAYLVGLACTRSNQVLRSTQYSYRKVPGTGTGFAYLVLQVRSTP